jgi:dephospho-CoA kinase
MIVALTGGIGSGKSTAARLFSDLGVPLIDTDRIARELTAPGGAVMPEILQRFGTGMVGQEGGLDRTKMRALILSDPRAKAHLEGLLHPRILAECQRRIASIDTAYALLIVPLLLESEGFRELAQRVLVVDCLPGQQVERSLARGGLNAEEVRGFIQAQASRAERLAIADDILDNSRDLEYLRAQVETLHPKYLELAKQR